MNKNQTPESKNNSLLTKFKEILEDLLGKVKGKENLSNEELYEIMCNEADLSEDDKNELITIYNEIDAFYIVNEEFKKSGKGSSAFLEDEIESIAKEGNPDATEEDVEQAKKAVAEYMDKEIERECDVLDGKEINTNTTVEPNNDIK